MNSLVRKFISLTLPLKILISTIFTVVAGPGLLAFVSEYATYSYALNENIRPPLEGIPYLFATVAIASIFLSFIAISIFILVRWVANWIMSSAIRNIQFLSIWKTKYPLESLKSFNSKKAIPLIFISSLIYSLLFHTLSFPAFFIVYGSIKWSWYAFFIMFIYFFIALLSLWKPIVNWFLGASFAVLFYLVSFTYIFDTNKYSNFLRYIKYGGGINIEIQYKDTGKKEKVLLVLRTSKYVFFKLSKKDSPQEMPLNLIRSIKYEK